LFDKKKKPKELPKQETKVPDSVKPPESIKDVNFTEIEQDKPKTEEQS